MTNKDEINEFLSVIKMPVISGTYWTKLHDSLSAIVISFCEKVSDEDTEMAKHILLM